MNFAFTLNIIDSLPSFEKFTSALEAKKKEVNTLHLLAIGVSTDKLCTFVPHKFLEHTWKSLVNPRETTVDWLSCDLLYKGNLEEGVLKNISEVYSGLFITPLSPYTNIDIRAPNVFRNTIEIIKTVLEADHKPAILGLCGGAQHLFCALGSIATGSDILHEEYKYTTSTDSEYGIVQLKQPFNSDCRDGGEIVEVKRSSKDICDMRLSHQSLDENYASKPLKLNLYASYGFSTTILDRITEKYDISHISNGVEIIGFELDEEEHFVVGSLSPKVGYIDEKERMMPAKILADFLYESIASANRYNIPEKEDAQ